MTRKIELINKLSTKLLQSSKFIALKEVFEDPKNLEHISIELNEQMQNIDKFVKIEYKDMVLLKLNFNFQVMS